MKPLDALGPIEFRSPLRSPSRLYTCTFIGWLGSGLTLSLLVVYRRDVHHCSTSPAALLLANADLGGSRGARDAERA